MNLPKPRHSQQQLQPQPQKSIDSIVISVPKKTVKENPYDYYYHSDQKAKQREKDLEYQRQRQLLLDRINQGNRQVAVLIGLHLNYFRTLQANSNPIMRSSSVPKLPMLTKSAADPLNQSHASNHQHSNNATADISTILRELRHEQNRPKPLARNSDINVLLERQQKLMEQVMSKIDTIRKGPDPARFYSPAISKKSHPMPLAPMLINNKESDEEEDERHFDERVREMQRHMEMKQLMTQQQERIEKLTMMQMMMANNRRREPELDDDDEDPTPRNRSVGSHRRTDGPVKKRRPRGGEEEEAKTGRKEPRKRPAEKKTHDMAIQHEPIESNEPQRNAPQSRNKNRASQQSNTPGRNEEPSVEKKYPPAESHQAPSNYQRGAQPRERNSSAPMRHEPAADLPPERREPNRPVEGRASNQSSDRRGSNQNIDRKVATQTPYEENYSYNNIVLQDRDEPRLRSHTGENATAGRPSQKQILSQNDLANPKETNSQKMNNSQAATPQQILSQKNIGSQQEFDNQKQINNSQAANQNQYSSQKNIGSQKDMDNQKQINNSQITNQNQNMSQKNIGSQKEFDNQRQSSNQRGIQSQQKIVSQNDIIISGDGTIFDDHDNHPRTTSVQHQLIQLRLRK